MTLALPALTQPYGAVPAGPVPAGSRPAARRLAAVPDPACRPIPVPDVRESFATVAVLNPPAGRQTAAPVRLTQRGVVVLTALVAVVGGLLFWAALRSAPASPAPVAPPASVTVHAGDTLWSIASRVAPQVDPFAEVTALQQANHLSGVAVYPGQVLRVPHSR